MRWIAMTAAAAVLAASAPGSAASRKVKLGEDPERIVCRSKASIGSRLARTRECRSAREWQELKEMDRLLMSIKQYNGDRSESPADTDGLISPN
ncbi:MAG TPA: hypothetical protein VF605_08880 [Allosphingosinicella sp.]|jgi:hypothetical protein